MHFEDKNLFADYLLTISLVIRLSIIIQPTYHPGLENTCFCLHTTASGSYFFLLAASRNKKGMTSQVSMWESVKVSNQQCKV